MNRTLAVTFENFGPPSKVLKVQSIPFEFNPKKVHVQMLAAPINPADLNAIEGVYPVKPFKFQNYWIPGFEGVGKVKNIEKELSQKYKLQCGDLVVPLTQGFGTWRKDVMAEAENLLKIPQGITVEQAAVCCVNPTTALLMLTEYGDLNRGDYVVQNGSTSMVGRSVIQISKEFGYKTINIVRDKKVEQELKSLGANEVVSEEEVVGFVKSNQLKIKLGLNMVGGKSSQDITRVLCEGGTMVTYGGMSKLPITVPTSAQIFRDITLKGFWLTRWRLHNPEKQTNVINQVLQLMLDKKLQISKIPKTNLQNFNPNEGKKIIYFD